MATYIALLRGINVGGNVLKMERLREIWSELGFEGARTYVQSGNVVFEAVGSASNWSQAVERKLAGEVRLPVTVFFRTARQFETLLSSNPFLTEKKIDRTKLHVTFLSDIPMKEASKKLNEIDAGADRFCVVGKEVYLYCPNGYGRTNLSNNAIEKVLSLKATTRNWNTVNKLHEMVSQ